MRVLRTNDLFECTPLLLTSHCLSVILSLFLSLPADSEMDGGSGDLEDEEEGDSSDDEDEGDDDDETAGQHLAQVRDVSRRSKGFM